MQAGHSQVSQVPGGVSEAKLSHSTGLLLEVDKVLLAGSSLEQPDGFLMKININTQRSAFSSQPIDQWSPLQALPGLLWRFLRFR